MAIIKCKECGGDVSSKAKACPKCGARPPKRRLVLKGLMIFFFFMVMYSAIHGNNQAPTNPSDYALSACREFIKKAAHDPSSVDFDRNGYSGVMEGKGGIFEITVTARAKNGFDALRHFATKCTMQHNNDSWVLIGLKEIKQ